MGELVLVRHGQASFGAADYDRLSPLGHQQARWLGEYFEDHGLRFARIFCGTLRRQRETAEGIRAVIGGAAEPDPRLNEFHYDRLEEAYLRSTGTDRPTSRAEFLASFPPAFAAWERGALDAAGESFADFEARVAGALEAALAPGGAALVVTSGGVIGVTLKRVLGLSPEATADLLLNIHNASVHRLFLEAGKLRLGLFNASPHLDPAERSHARTYV